MRKEKFINKIIYHSYRDDKTSEREKQSDSDDEIVCRCNHEQQISGECILKAILIENCSIKIICPELCVFVSHSTALSLSLTYSTHCSGGV